MVPEDLIDVLERTWQAISCEYDVSADLPDMQTLFGGANLIEPDRAAEIVVAKMVMEVSECVGRFSPWYTLPGSAFGLIAARDHTTNCLKYTLAPEAAEHWAALLGPLALAIQKNVGLILAAQVVDGAMRQPQELDPRVMAWCSCSPPHTILINRSSLKGTGVVCEQCHATFQEFNETAGIEVS